MDILVVSYLLILSSTLLFGTGTGTGTGIGIGIGTAFYLLMTSWTQGNSGDAASCWLPVVWL